tara:strand:- start:238 stop:480 length:243 start_codon:yes stop_codon:yes gene_type:complete
MDPFVDIIYIVVVVPTLLYLGLKKGKSPNTLFSFALLLGVLTLIYHVSNLLNLQEVTPQEEYDTVPDRSNNAEISNNIID